MSHQTTGAPEQTRQNDAENFPAQRRGLVLLSCETARRRQRRPGPTAVAVPILARDPDDTEFDPGAPQLEQGDDAKIDLVLRRDSPAFGPRPGTATMPKRTHIAMRRQPLSAQDGDSAEDVPARHFNLGHWQCQRRQCRAADEPRFALDLSRQWHLLRCAAAATASVLRRQHPARAVAKPVLPPIRSRRRQRQRPRPCCARRCRGRPGATLRSRQFLARDCDDAELDLGPCRGRT